MKKKSLFIAIGVVIACIVIYNIVWFFNWHKYNRYKDAVGYEESTGRYFTQDSEGFRYAVFAPDYLSFTGNLTIGNNVWGENNEQSMCSFIIWPLFLGGYEFGVNIFVPAYSEDGYAYTSYSFLLDENGNCLTELTSDEKTMLEENSFLIQKVYQKAYDMFGIGTGISSWE